MSYRLAGHEIGIISNSVIPLNDDKGSFTNVSGNGFPEDDVTRCCCQWTARSMILPRPPSTNDDGNQVFHETYSGLHEVSAPLILIRDNFANSLIGGGVGGTISGQNKQNDIHRHDGDDRISDGNRSAILKGGKGSDMFVFPIGVTGLKISMTCQIRTCSRLTMT